MGVVEYNGMMPAREVLVVIRAFTARHGALRHLGLANGERGFRPHPTPAWCRRLAAVAPPADVCLAVERKFSSQMRRCGLYTETTRVAVALSGGPDSLALAALAKEWQLQSAKGLPVALIVDHQLRPEGAAEASAAAQQAAELGLEPHLLRVDWQGAPPRPGDKLVRARDERYHLLLTACQRLGVRHLLVAHHADDQAETFLLRLVRGSGIAGLACMPVISQHAGFPGISVVRPLLHVHKWELLEYCRARGLRYAEDPTNADLSYQRNYIRHMFQHFQALSDRGGVGGSGIGTSSGAGKAAAETQQEKVTGHQSGISAMQPQQQQQLEQHVPQIVQDILQLHRCCAEVAAAQWAEAEALLRAALLSTSVPELPSSSSSSSSETEEVLLKPPLGNVLAELAAQLGSLRCAVLHVPPLGAAQEGPALAALRCVMQAVAQREYPPGYEAAGRLCQRMRQGKLVGAYTGGGCLVLPVTRSKGTCALVVPQAAQQQAQAAMQHAVRSSCGARRRRAYPAHHT